MRETFIDRKFSNDNLGLIDIANQIIFEYQAHSLTLTLRQLYYQFVARGHIPNTVQSYKRLGSIVNDARLAGLIDWDSIEDRTRNLESLGHWDNPGDIIRSARSSFRIGKWAGQAFRPEVWIEKEALAGVIQPVCNELDISYFACRGYVSQSEMYSAAQRLIRYSEDGQVPVIIHLGDHDPSGIDMSRDISDRIEMFRRDDDFTFIRIALNMDQVRELNPPPNPAKMTDSRFAGYITKFGAESWELDAIDPIRLQDLIRNTVLEYRDDEKYSKALDKEEDYVEVLKRVEKNWKSL